AECCLQILRVLRHLLAGPQSYVRLLPVRTIPGKLSSPPLFPRIIRRAHRVHFHFEDCLHRFFDLRLGRLGRNLEDQRVLVFLDAQALLCNYRPANNLICGLHIPTLPPPLSWSGYADCAPPSSALSSRRHLRRLCARALKKGSSAKPAASQLPAARKSRGHTAADDKDAPRCCSPVRFRRGSASSGAGCGFRGSPLPPALRLYRPSENRAPREMPASSALSRRTHSPQSACRQRASPPMPNATPPAISCGERCNRRNAVAVRAPCRRAATVATGSSPRARAPYPSASKVSCPHPKPVSCFSWHECRPV